MITSTMTMRQIISQDETISLQLMRHGLHCFSCPLANQETLAQACIVHGLDVDYVVETLNEFLGGT